MNKHRVQTILKETIDQLVLDHIYQPTTEAEEREWFQEGEVCIAHPAMGMVGETGLPGMIQVESWLHKSSVGLSRLLTDVLFDEMGCGRTPAGEHGDVVSVVGFCFNHAPAEDRMVCAIQGCGVPAIQGEGPGSNLCPDHRDQVFGLVDTDRTERMV